MTSTSTEHTNWTAAGADTAAKNTYASIQRALKDLAARRNIEIFLQGSYANSTNIRDDSDVDIVVMTRRTFSGSVNRLGTLAKAQWDRLPDATYHESDLRSEVIGALRDYYGAPRVHPRNKCIRVDGSDDYVDADVVPAIEYRYFAHPDADVTKDYVEGIAINPANETGRIINFPKEHIANGQTKNEVCGGRYKKTVRQVKRLRNRAVDEGRLDDDVAPGYLLECMVYNAPVTEFVQNDSERLKEVVLWLHLANKSGFKSCDGIHDLFKTDPGNFDVGTADAIADALWGAH